MEQYYRLLLKSKIHRAVVTEANLDYVGSITLDPVLARAADLWEHEQVLVADVTTGNRLETYVLYGEEGSGEVCLNGAAAHLFKKGEEIIIMSFTWSKTPIQAKIVICAPDNSILDICATEPPNSEDPIVHP
ncbi:MAG: aspartate 1-decarboxylase [bacterium]|nr:aspartate 1-decarboxylase [bacterium]